jgi:hypothetical protein
MPLPPATPDGGGPVGIGLLLPIATPDGGGPVGFAPVGIAGGDPERL